MATNLLKIENAKIPIRNFSGKEGTYNPKGRRNFCVLLDSDIAETLAKDGWNVRWLKPRNKEDPLQAYLPVAVSYSNFPPNIYTITKRGKTLLTEDTIMILDWADIEKVDLVIRPYEWNVSGNTGIKAYIKTMYVTLVEDEFADKYRDVPDSAGVPDGEPAPWDTQ